MPARDSGANPSAEGGGEEEGADDQAVKVRADICACSWKGSRVRASQPPHLGISKLPPSKNVTCAPGQVNDVVDAFNLQSMGSMDKKGVLAW